MLSFLRGIEPYGLNKKGGGGRGTGRIQIPLETANESALAVWSQDQHQKKRLSCIEVIRSHPENVPSLKFR